MKILVTAGSTQMPIDKVRIISNIFKGTTGAFIAKEAYDRNHQVTLIANPNTFKLIREKHIEFLKKEIPYKTFDELNSCMEQEITTGNYDIIIHSAAVSDYKVSAAFDNIHDLKNWTELDSLNYGGLERTKIPSGKNLYLALTPTEKLVDKIRPLWGFKGKLVKFKLQVGMTTEQLLEIAKKSRATSNADLIVANHLEGFDDWSVPQLFIVNSNDAVISCNRENLAKRLFDILDYNV